MAAATAAREASDAANRATTSADAEMHQADAESQQGMAADALTNAGMYADMVAQAKAQADDDAEEASALMTAKSAAQAAHDAAMKSSNDASAAVAAVAGSKDLNVTTAAAYARAEDAAADAANALLDAIAANALAQGATSSADAAGHQADAEAAMRAAGIAYTSAKGFAEVVTQQQDMADTAATEAMKLSEAQDAANAAAMAARTAADAAQEAADKIAELAGATSAAAMSAQMLATEAENAAVAAANASANADADTSSADAEAEQMAAMTGQMTAEGNLVTLVQRRDDAQVAYDATHKQLEAQALTDAQEATQDAADEVADHLTAVQGKADDARTQATNARRAANAAKAARRDYENADKYATMAEAEATKAEAALARAMQADTDAQAALTAALAAETSAEAEAEQAKAEAANDIATEAHTGTTGAGMAYMAAKAAAEKAMDAADVLVASYDILRVANQEGVTPAALREARIEAINAAINLRAADDDVREPGDSDTPNSAPGTTNVEPVWRYHGDLGDDNQPGGDTTNADSKPGEGVLTFDEDLTSGEDSGIFMVGVTSVTFMYDNPLTAGRDESTFDAGLGLGDFAEYHVSADPAATDVDGLPRTRVILFTDKEQAAAPIAAETVTFVNMMPVAERISGWTGTAALYDHDGDEGDGTTGTEPVPVSVSCTDTANAITSCGATEIGATGLLSAISGYRISSLASVGGAAGSFDVPAVVELDDATYLVFGVWLTETAGASDTDPNVYTYGAFANGGTGVATGGLPATVKGTATYNGSAAGLHSKPTGADFFHGDATLTANFDVKDTAGDEVDGGSIHGRIHNIVSGGTAISESIHLDVTPGTALAANITADGTFTGRARAGAGTTSGLTGATSYPFNGTWQGNFYNPAVDNPRTLAVDESLTPPGSVAGTFGVAHTDDMGTPLDATDDETQSFVGAFGAHKE